MKRGGTIPKLTLAGLVSKQKPTPAEKEVIRILTEVYDLLKTCASQMDHLNTSCRYCGNPLYTRNDVKKYCSASCRAMANNMLPAATISPGPIKSDFIRVTGKMIRRAKARVKAKAKK